MEKNGIQWNLHNFIFWKQLSIIKSNEHSKFKFKPNILLQFIFYYNQIIISKFNDMTILN